jgi:hypothetical protein
MRYNIPLVPSKANSALRKWAVRAGRGLDKKLETFGQAISLERKLGKREADLIKELQGQTDLVEELSLMLGESVVGISNKAVPAKFGKFEFKMPAFQGKQLTRAQQNLLGLSVLYGSYAGYSGKRLKEAIISKKGLFGDIFIEKAGKKLYLRDLPSEILENIGRGAEQFGALMDEGHALGQKKASKGSRTYWDDYAPVVVGGWKEGDDIKVVSDYIGYNAFFEKSRRIADEAATVKPFATWHQELKELPYKIVTDPQKMVIARLKPVLIRAVQEDILQKAADAGVINTSKAGLHRLFATDPFMARMLDEDPGLAFNIIDKVGARGATRTYLSEASDEVLKKFFEKIHRMTDSEDIYEEITKKNAFPDDLSIEAVERLKTEYQDRLNEQLRYISSTDPGDAKFASRKEHIEALKSNQELFNAKLNSIAEQQYNVAARLRAKGMTDDIFENKLMGIRKDKYIKKQRLLNEIKGLSIGKGVEEYMTAWAAKISSGKDVKFLSEHSDTVLEKMAELLKTQPGAEMAEKIKEFVNPIEAFAREDGKLIKDKLANISIKHPITKETVDAEHFSYSRPFIEEFVDIVHPGELSGKGIRGIYHAIDAVANPLKRFLTVSAVPIPGLRWIPRVAFHGRNIVDLIFRSSTNLGLHNVIGGADEWRHAARAMAGAAGEFVVKNGPASGYTMTYDNLRKMLMEGGFWRHDFSKRIGTRATRAKDLEKIDGIISSAKDSYRTMQRDLSQFFARKMTGAKGAYILHTDKLGTGLENLAMAKNAIALLNRGHPLDNVIQKLQTHLFTYNNMTSFERNFLRRFLLFYPFQSQALPFVWDTLKKRPRHFKYMQALKDSTYLSREEEAATPEWVKDFPTVRIDKSNRKQFKIYGLRNMFTLDTIGDLVPQQLSHIFGKINPVVTIIPEIMMGHNLYFNKPIGEDVNIYGPFAARKKLQYRKVSEMLQTVKPLRDFLQYQEFTYPSNGQKAITVNASRWHLLTRLHYSRFFRELNEIGLMAQGDRDVEDWLLNFFIGIKTYQMDIEKQMQFLNYAAQNNKKAYDRAVSRGDREGANQILRRMRLTDGN